MPTSAKKSQFLILLRQPPGGAPQPEELKKIMAQFQIWMDDIRARHLVLSSNGLVPTTGRVLRGPNGLTEIDGPYAETKEIMGGYVLLEADTFDEAVAAGRACPGLNYGMTVEVRTVMARG